MLFTIKAKISLTAALNTHKSMLSVPITTDVESSSPDQDEVYNIMWSSLSVTCDKSVVFSGSSDFLHQ
jgi:hypothetical protein